MATRPEEAASRSPEQACAQVEQKLMVRYHRTRKKTQVTRYALRLHAETRAETEKNPSRNLQQLRYG